MVSLNLQAIDPTLAPMFDIEVENQSLSDNVKRLVQSIEYESSDNLVDIMKIRCSNPDALISNAKVFQPGNEVALYAGYGSQGNLDYVGRAIIIDPVHDFPESGNPSVEVVAYTKDKRMMDSAPDQSWSAAFREKTYSEAVEDVNTNSTYRMETDIDDTGEEPHDFIQKSGMSDYDFVRGLANITGYSFWTDADAKGIWTLHFKNPANLPEHDKYTFRYGDGAHSTLLSFRPEMLVSGAATKIAIVVKDVTSGEVIKTEIEEEGNNAPDMSAAGDLIGTVQGEQTTASDIKLFFNDFSFNIISNRKFTNAAQATAWAQEWFRRMRENFILAQGVTVGWPTLRARQTHTIDGSIGSYNGEYYFSRVRHILGQGYKCDFSARKVIPS